MCLPRPAKAETPTQPEAIIALIERYRAGMRAFNASDESLSSDELAAFFTQLDRLKQVLDRAR